MMPDDPHIVQFSWQVVDLLMLLCLETCCQQHLLVLVPYYYYYSIAWLVPPRHVS
jgi:hypothetical protein